MKIGSLCTGYGGLDLAVETVTGAKTVWYSEFDKHVAKLMQHNRPELPNLWDLTKINWTEVQPVDILTAGYPCQPFSGAGQRKGTHDERHIWPHISKAISVLQPKLVVLENVRGHLTLGFNEVLGALTQIGYDAKWEIIRACDIGAPHQRARLFVIAYPESTRRGTQQNRPGSGGSQESCALGSFIKPDYSLTTDAYSNAHQKPRRTDRGISSKASAQFDGTNRAFNWGSYQAAVTRWEELTRPAPNPVTDDRLEPKFVEWLMGLAEGWVTNAPLNRNQQLKALGNGVVPQQAAYALQLLLNKSDTP